MLTPQFRRWQRLKQLSENSIDLFMGTQESGTWTLPERVESDTVASWEEGGSRTGRDGGGLGATSVCILVRYMSDWKE